LYWLNFFLYLAIFGFFRCYPMYLVDEFHLGVSRVSEFIAWVGVPIVLANVWLTGFLSTRMSVRTLTFWSALLTGVFMVIVVVPRPQRALWVTLFLTSGALALCLPSCATLLSVAASETDQGCVMATIRRCKWGPKHYRACWRSSRCNNGQAFPDRAGRDRNRCRGVLTVHSHTPRGTD
jgi:predicted MFS family arabinose efflux permease